MNLFLTVPLATLASAWSLRQMAKRKSTARKSGSADFANIGEGARDTGHISLLGDTNTPPQTTSRFLLVKFSTDGDHFTTCGAGDTPLGTNQDVYDTNNTDVPNNIAIFGAAPGTQKVVTDGSITNGAVVTTGANGQATAYASTGPKIGRACFGTDTTASAGDIIPIVAYAQ